MCHHHLRTLGLGFKNLAREEENRTLNQAEAPGNENVYTFEMEVRRLVFKSHIPQKTLRNVSRFYSILLVPPRRFRCPTL